MDVATAPLKAEIPLDGLEAFRLASFGIEYVPQYAPLYWDRHTLAAKWFSLHGDRWQRSHPNADPSELTRFCDL